MILPPAHGGQLQQLMLPEPPAGLERLPFLKLSPRQQCDVEMLLTGAFSPLEGFLGRDDYLAVLQTGRLADGTLWPLPIVLDVDAATLAALKSKDQLLLLDAELYPVAVLQLRDMWQPDRAREAKILYGSDDPAHDGVRHLLYATASHCVSGRLLGIRLPACRFQSRFRTTPDAQRTALENGGHGNCLAWFAFEPPVRDRIDRLNLQLAACNAVQLLLLHSPHVTPIAAPPARVTAHCLAALQPRLAEFVRVSYCSVPLWPRWAGARELIWHAIICQNFGAGHYLIDETGAVAALGDGQRPPATRLDQELLEHARRELAIRFVAGDDPGQLPFERAVAATAAGNEAGTGQQYPEVAEILRHRGGRGFTLFLTGLSGAGKSSLAHALAERLETGYGRAVTVLDGDYSRLLLTSDLGAAPSDQLGNVQRHAFVAAEVTRHGGIAIVALVAPYAAARAGARRVVEPWGGFIEVYLSAPAPVCENRDQKGIYARAKGGYFGDNANIADRYQAPESPDIVADSMRYDTETLAEQIIEGLVARGYLSL